MHLISSFGWFIFVTYGWGGQEHHQAAEHEGFRGVLLRVDCKVEKGVRAHSVDMQEQGESKAIPEKLKRVNQRAISVQDGYELLKPLRLNKTAQNYRTKRLTISYQTTFGLSTKSDVVQTIFRFKNVSETDYAKILTEPAQLFIDSWRGLGDRPLFQEDMLVFLRGIYAKVANKLPPNS